MSLAILGMRTTQWPFNSHQLDLDSLLRCLPIRILCDELETQQFFKTQWRAKTFERIPCCLVQYSRTYCALRKRACGGKRQRLH